MTNVINNKYSILNKIGNGKFGFVYKGQILRTGELVAIKLENASNDYKTIKHESKILNYLYKNGCRNIPSIYWFGNFMNFTCMVINYFEISLSSYIKNNVLDFNQRQKIMLYAIDIFENIHKYYVVHRDIKPDNFMIKSIDSFDIYLIDFGMSSFYIDDNGEHKKEFHENSQNGCIIGTPKFTSYYIHNNCQYSRRDDLISLGYIYLYLYDGVLPWEKVPFSCNDTISELYINNKKNIYRKNMKAYENIESKITEIGNGLDHYMKYCYNLKYDELPKYSILKHLFDIS